MSSKHLKEIRAIIQNDIIQSTYKLALLRAIIEIVHEFNKNKITLEGVCAYPFSLLQHRLLIYYYPLFAHPSFVPQALGETTLPHNKRQLTIRTSMSPIIQYYHSNGGYEELLSDLENDRVPDEIAAEYSSLFKTIRRVFIAQPMKYLGNSLRSEEYTVVRYLACLPENEGMPSTFPAKPDGYYTISQEYARIFEKPSCAQQLLDLVVQRWIEYTLSLSDTLTHEELYELLVPGFHVRTDEIERQPALGASISLLLPAPISTRFEKSISSRENPMSPTSMVPALEEAIRAEYAQFSSHQRNIQNNMETHFKVELRSQRIDESIWRIEALYGVSPRNDVSQGSFETLSRYYAEQQAAQEVYSDITVRSLASRRKLTELKQKRDWLQQMVQKVMKDLVVRKRQQDLIDQLRHELTLLDDGFEVQPRPFGYIDKPIARFLTYCGDVALDILSQCLHLIPDPEEATMVKPALPTWFIDEFDTWWMRKQEVQMGSRGSGSEKTSTRKPYLTFNEHHHKVQLVIPSQVIEHNEGLDHVTLIIHDSSQILYEEELPLYSTDEGLVTEDILVRVERPSQHYHVELSAPGVSPWMVNGFSNSGSVYLFNYETGKYIEQQRIPPKRFILLTRSEPTITPEEAVLFTGRLFGGWYDFQYYDIDPTNGLVIGNPQAPSGEGGREPVKLDLRIDPGYFDRYLRVDEWSVIPGSPPHIQILFADKGVLSSTTLSVHPRGRGPALKPIFHSLGEPGEEVEIDPDGHICTVDLGHPSLLGRERAGAFTIRVHNESCRTDIRVECVFLPGISYRFSKSLYLPTDGALPVQLDITCPGSVRFEPDGAAEADITETGFTVTSNLVPTIQGKLWYPAGNGGTFEGILSISVPHAAWRFEDEATRTIYPLRRSVPMISDTDYWSLGTDPGLRVFLPESFSGTGTISMLPQNQTVTCRVVKGQGYFALARFNDTLRTNDAKCMHFEFSLEDPHGEGIRFLLFTLQRWYIHLPNPPHVSIDLSGNHTIEIEWEEYGIASKRYLILWKKKESGSISRVYVEEIPATVRNFIIQGDRELPLSPGIYYVQFYRLLNDWGSLPVSFSGERGAGIFPLRIEQSKDRSSGEQPPESGRNVPGSSDPLELDAGIERLIGEIESGEPERVIQALRDLKGNYSIRRINHHLLEKYPVQYERLQAALFAVMVDTRVSGEIRSTSVGLLGKNFNQEREHILITVLASPDSTKDLRIAILKALGRGSTDACLNALLTVLDDPDPDIRVELAASLGNIDNKDAVKPLIALLDDESVAVQRKAAASLGYTRSHAASGLLISIAFDEKQDTILRITAISGLAKFRLNEQVTRELFTLSKKIGENEDVRKIATSVLSIQGKLDVEEKKRHITDLIKEVKTSSHGKRISAIKQLSAFGDEEVILALMEATRDESVDVRRVSADSLRRINKPMAIPVLVRLCDDPDDDIRRTAEFACRQLLDMLMSDLKQTSDKRDTAAGHLSRIGPLAVNPLLDMLRKSENIQSERADSGEIRNSIVDALSRMNDPDAIALIIQALQDKNDLVVWGAARALGTIGDASAINPLKEAWERYVRAKKLDSRMTYVWMEIKRALQLLNG